MAAKNKKSKKHSNFPLIFTMLLSMVLVAVIVFGIFVLVNDPVNPENDENRTDTTTTDIKKELKTNTDEEKPEDPDTETVYDDEKTGYESGNQEKQVEKDTDGKKIANVTLNIAQADSFIILSGRVTNFKEEGGNCVYKLKQNGSTKEYTSKVIPDAKNTVCEAVKLEKSSLISGQWTVWMEYQSNNAKGTSETQTINI